MEWTTGMVNWLLKSCENTYQIYALVFSDFEPWQIFQYGLQVLLKALPLACMKYAAWGESWEANIARVGVVT